jgi:hypothetical protein
MAKVKELQTKALNEAFSLMEANIEVLRLHRGKRFMFRDLRSYVDVACSLKASGGQSEAVFDLHTESVKHHYDIFSSLSDSLGYKEEPYTEHLQGPGILELLYEMDPYLRSFVDRFISQLDKSIDLIIKEGERKHSGFYGPVCAADFALTPGSTANVLNQVLRSMDVAEEEKYYARTILAAKSWGMNTSYIFGWRFIDATEGGRTKKEAAIEEITALKYIFDKPIESEIQMMREEKLFPFGVENYLRKYQKKMSGVVQKAVEEKVNYANILSIPAVAVGDIGHHLCQSSYDLYKDDYYFDMLEGVYETVKKNMASIDSYDSLGQMLSCATALSASSLTYILESEGFSADNTNELLLKRFHDFVKKYPYRGAGIEFHNVDFMDVIFRGSRILHRDQGIVKGKKIDFAPLWNKKIIKEYRGIVYPNLEMNRAFSALMRFADHFCLINIEPITMALMTNILAKDPLNSLSPIKGCKKCAVSALKPERCSYCERTKAI